MRSALARHADVAKVPQWQLKDQLSQKAGPHATVYLINGDRYIGDWKDNKRHGKGMHFYKRNGHLYEGEWENDMRQGYGTLSVPIRSETRSSSDAEDVNPSASAILPPHHHGHTHHDVGGKTGAAAAAASSAEAAAASATAALHEDTLFSRATTPSSKKKPSKGHDMAIDELRKVYAGQWYGDKRHGIGTYFYEDGSVYEGRWENDMKEGWGRMAYANGSVYEGEWHHEKRHGQGILLLPNGDRYEGMWLNDDKEGPGKFVYRTKRQAYEGEWAKGLPKCGTLRDLPPLPGQREKQFAIPPLALSDPTGVLETQRQLIYDERVQRMMGVHDETVDN